MARKVGPGRQHTGVFYAREARGMTRSKLVELTGVSKQQLSRLENGLVRLRLDHLKPFANALNYTPEQILLWGRYPGTTGNADASEGPQEGPSYQPQMNPPANQVPELDARAGMIGGVPPRDVRTDGNHTDPIKSEGWVFPAGFVREQLHAAAPQLLVVGATGDSMAPTIGAGDRVILDTAHRTPSPDGLYAIRDAIGGVVIKRLQLVRSSRPSRVKVISDNPHHATEEVPVSDLEIVGKVLCGLKLY
jgi:phage repressor protein C with HTH and peptisase S24 domain/DNA-binding Xre family transcriptional regulator